MDILCIIFVIPSILVCILGYSISIGGVNVMISRKKSFENDVPTNPSRFSSLIDSEDWWAVWLGLFVILMAAFGVVTQVPSIQGWNISPLEALTINQGLNLLIMGFAFALILGVSVVAMKGNLIDYLIGFPLVFVITVIAFLIGKQTIMSHYGLGYVIWALVFGIILSNIWKIPDSLKSAIKGELYIKIGLVLLGAEILFERLLFLGIYGIGVAWLVTPIVLIGMYFVGTKLLNISSKSLVVTISAATSVCGVSAAIAAGGASKAKQEELCLALSITSIFTILMMVLMPLFINAVGMDPLIGGAWVGGTIDATGAVVVSASVLGQEAVEIAATIKMIQNVLIGIIAFIIAFLWVSKIEKGISGEKPNLSEIWIRFPKFIFGFVLASILFSFVFLPLFGETWVSNVHQITGSLRNWLFALAFVSIGLNAKLNEIGTLLRGGKPVLLYVLGQSLNIILTYIAAYIMFSGIIFPRPF